MSYKGAANKIAYITRSANHSTKPRKTGDNAHLALQPEINSLLTGIKERAKLEIANNIILVQLTKKKEAILEELKKIRDRLQFTLPKKTAQSLLGYSKQLGREISQIQIEQANLRKLKRDSNSFTDCGFDALYRKIAQQVLPKNMAYEIYRTAMDIFAAVEKGEL